MSFLKKRKLKVYKRLKGYNQEKALKYEYYRKYSGDRDFRKTIIYRHQRTFQYYITEHFKVFKLHYFLKTNKDFGYNISVKLTILLDLCQIIAFDLLFIVRENVLDFLKRHHKSYIIYKFQLEVINNIFGLIEVIIIKQLLFECIILSVDE